MKLNVFWPLANFLLVNNSQNYGTVTAHVESYEVYKPHIANFELPMATL